jgi:hypothetical protein
LALIEIVQIDFEFDAPLPLAHDHTPEATTPLNIGSKKLNARCKERPAPLLRFRFN